MRIVIEIFLHQLSKLIHILYWPFILFIAWLPSVSIYYFLREIVAPVRHEPAFCTMPGAGWLTIRLCWQLSVIRWYFTIFPMKYINYVFNCVKNIFEECIKVINVLTMIWCPFVRGFTVLTWGKRAKRVP